MNLQFSKTYTTCFSNGKIEVIEVQVMLRRGLSKFDLIGLPQNMIREGRDRILAALYSLGIEFPSQRVTVSLNPGNIPKEGSHFDLPIVVALLQCLGLLPEPAKKTFYWGEIELDGRVQVFKDYIPHYLAVNAKASCDLISNPPKKDLERFSQFIESEMISIEHISSLLQHTKNELKRQNSFLPNLNEEELFKLWLAKDLTETSWKSLKASPEQFLILSLITVGNHHVLFEGSPGVGKSLWPKIIWQLQPPVDAKKMAENLIYQSPYSDEAIERIFHIPFITPHHSSSAAAIVGGGSGKVNSGAITRAHQGILFLDEIAEFPKHVIETLREPLEEGFIQISRSGDSQKLPAKVQLLAAKNPCPCGNYQSEKSRCICSSSLFYRYRAKISGPILDRFHWHLWWDYHDQALYELISLKEWKKRIYEAKKLPAPQVKISSFPTDMNPRKQIRFLDKLQAWGRWHQQKEVNQNDAEKLYQLDSLFRKKIIPLSGAD